MLYGFERLRLIPGIVGRALTSIAITTNKVIHFLAFKLLVPELFCQGSFCHYFLLHDALFLF